MDASRNTVRLQFLHGDVVCFAMEQAGMPIVRELRVYNDGIESLVGAELGIQLQPDLGAEMRFSIPVLASGQVHELTRPTYDSSQADYVKSSSASARRCACASMYKANVSQRRSATSTCWLSTSGPDSARL